MIDPLTHAQRMAHFRRTAKELALPSPLEYISTYVNKPARANTFQLFQTTTRLGALHDTELLSF